MPESKNKTLIKRALISVYDKTGIIEFAQFLCDRGVEILSTGGSAKTIRDAGLSVREVSDYTGFPEILDGRVKTLHPIIHGGILCVRGNSKHEEAISMHEIAPIDMLIVNLYPFNETVKSGADFDECIENIDIGGPSLIRAAAKNHSAVTIVINPEDYMKVMHNIIENDGNTTDELRKELAAKAFSRTASYDATIAGWFNRHAGIDFPKRLTFGGELVQRTRYGENPHQEAAYYSKSDGNVYQRKGIATAAQLQGKELSYNNLNDTDAAFELIAEFDEPAVAIIKHANPCGAAIGENLTEAYKKALACDPVSAFGGIVAVNRTLDEKTAEEIIKTFTEVVIAPEVTEQACKVFSKKKNLRLLVTGGMPDKSEKIMQIKSLADGFLMQTSHSCKLDETSLETVTERKPTEQEIKDMLFAYTVAGHTKSNAIVYVKNGATVGIGAGQMSRVDSSKIASRKSMEATEAANSEEPFAKGSVVASDAFFPFADGLVAAAEAGATAVIQPGGSIRDEEVIKAADEHKIAMVFTGKRFFKH